MEKILLENAKSNIYPFHMPGHKRNVEDIINPYDIDITEIEGFDNLHNATGIIKKAQDGAAKLYGAEHSYFLINGSTCGILAALSAAVERGGKVLVARNCHKAVYHGIYLRQLKPVFMHPNITSSGIQGQITAEQVKLHLEQNADIKAVFITSPTYDGVVSDVEKIAQIVHKNGIPLIVDEAHGAHFGFGGGFPLNATKLGADAVILSVHKTLPAYTQTALLNICSDRIDHRKIEKFLGIYETSSPSYILMSGIDKCIRYIRENGKIPFMRLRKNLDEFYKNTRLSNLRLVKKSDFTKKEAFDFDDSKILIFTDKTNISGQELLEILLNKYDIQLEMAAGSYALALCSIMDTKNGFDRLSSALMEIDKTICSTVEIKQYDTKQYGIKQDDIKLNVDIYQNLCKSMEICDAYEALTKRILLVKSVGQVSAEFVYLYPPGIPLVVPGEIINEKLVNDINKAISLNMEIDGLTYDKKGNAYVNCVDENYYK